MAISCNVSTEAPIGKKLAQRALPLSLPKRVCMSFIGDRASSLRLDQAANVIEKDQRAEDDAGEPTKKKRARPLQAFKYADKTDVTLMTISWICAAGLGVCPVSLWSNLEA